MKLAELTTTAVLLGVLSVACASLLHAQAQLLRSISDRAAGGEALRSAASILAAEVREMTIADVRAVGADSVALRVQRGWAIVSRVEGNNVFLRHQGIREPDPLKDSLLVVGSERVASFTLVRTAETAIQSSLLLRPGNVVVLFESGAYHLATNALRYRRGVEGRQPITDELLDHRASRFALEANAKLLRVHLQARASGGEQSPNATMRIRLINQGQ